MTVNRRLALQSAGAAALLAAVGRDAFAQAQLEYRLVYRVMFEERVKRSLLARMVGSSHERFSSSWPLVRVGKNPNTSNQAPCCSTTG